MTYYEKKRMAKGLARSDVANMLGIGYRQYESIERGDKKMPNRLINKFNEIINKGKNELKLETLNREKDIDEWINEMRVKVNGVPKLKGKMDEFNIDTYNDLARLMGYSNGSVISNLISGNRPSSYDLKNNIYTFFQDELNIQDKKVKVLEPKAKKRLREIVDEENEEYIEYYKNFDTAKWLKKNNLQLHDFAKACGIPKSTMYYYVNPRNSTVIPRVSTIKKVKESIEKYERKYNTNKEILDNSKEEDLFFPILDEIDPNEENNLKNKLIKKYTSKIDELSGQATDIIKSISVMKEDLENINNQKAIYEEILFDIKGEY